MTDLRNSSGLKNIRPNEKMKTAHKKWVESCLTDRIKRREECWTRSVAVWSKGFVNKVKSIMGVSAIGRNCVPADDSYQLREPQVSYYADFGSTNGIIGTENTFEWR